MIELIDLVDERFMPHGHCYFWEPSVLWSYAISDSIIATAYFSIPLALSYIYLKRKDFSYVWIMILFAIFIAGCGITHVFDVVNIWKPLYKMDVIARIITAMASIATAAVLIKYTPKIIDIPTAEQWKKVNEELRTLNDEFLAVNEELHSANEELQAQIEELKERDKTIQAYKEFERLTETLPQMIWTTNPHITSGNIAVTGEAMYINRRWYEYTGIEEGKPFDEIFTNCMLDQEAQYNKWIEQREKREGYEIETLIKRQDGEYRWHLHRASYTPETNSWVGSFTDIHDQKMYTESLAAKNAELIRINTDLDNFIYTASHDLKSPIANIEGLTTTLTKKLTTKFTLDDEQNRILSMIAGSVNRLKSTISDLTEIAKAQKEDEEKEIVSVSKVIEEVTTDLDKLIVDKQVVLDKRLEIDEITIAPKNLRSIIYNLLSNAIKYRSQDRTPEIIIETKRLNKYMVIQVADNGIGIAENSLPKVFTMFKRFHTHVEGTGIGLYIVKRIVDNAGGKIEVESRVDIGTTFKVYLPYEQ
jgi:PAS domain S-box-containing protein